jgi:hypothetical protein
MLLKGHCYCGAVRYEADGELKSQSFCHCSICRRCSSAPVVAWFTVPDGSFRFVTGEPMAFKSSDHATRTFCPTCGTPLTFQSTRYPGEIDITTCSLDDPEQLPPKRHIFTRSRLSWMKLDDGLPTYPTSTSGSG